MMNTDDRKRILYLDNSQGYGGSVICLELLLQGLDRSQYEPIVSVSYKDESYRNLEQAAPLHYLPHRLFDKNKWMSRFESQGSFPAKFFRTPGFRLLSLLDYLFNVLPYVLKLILFMRKHRIDLVHLNNEPVSNMGGLLAAKFLKLPVVNHVRGEVLSWNTPTARWLYAKVDRFITVADWVKGEVVSMGVPADRIQTIWDGRDLAPFKVEEARDDIRYDIGIEGDQIAIGMFSRLNPWKGHKVFIEALQLVMDQTPGIIGFIVGGATERLKEYEKELKELVKSKGLGKRIIFLGQRSDIPRLLKAMDIVVHASLDPDPYPGVVLEAMLMGRPLIASSEGGPAEAIDDHVSGLHCPPGDPVLLRDRIKELINNRELRQNIGTQSEKISWERYALENHVTAVQGVYGELL